MKVIFHEDYYQVYTSDPASAPGRLEAIMNVIDAQEEVLTPEPAGEEDILAVHSKMHLKRIKEQGLFHISALAAGGAMLAAETGLNEPAFAVIRPPGHHASADSCWGFCFFNNMAIALESLKREKKIESAYILDIDLHYGDGNVNILDKKGYVNIYNVDGFVRTDLMRKLKKEIDDCKADIIGISAGFDNHIEDWGGTLQTEDYFEIGRMVRAAAVRNKGGCFGILEGGYNHRVLGYNVKALIDGLKTV